MLIFSVSFRFNGCSPKGIRRKHRRIEKRNSTAKVHKSKSDKRTSTNKYRKRHQDCTHEPKIGPKEAENDPRSSPKWCQEGPERPKTGPEAAQNDPKRSLRRSKKRTQTTRRKKNRTKSIPRPSWTAPGPISTAQPPPPGAIWEAKTAPKSIPKRSKIEAKNQESKKPIQDDLGSVLRRFWAILGDILGPWKRSKHYACRCFVQIHVLEQIRCQEATWVDLELILGRFLRSKRNPRGTKNETKMTSKF